MIAGRLAREMQDWLRNQPRRCPTCAGTGRGMVCRTTTRGNTVVDHYGTCPDCTEGTR